MQPYNVYAIGQTVLIEAFNVDDDDDPISPEDPKILLRMPNGTETPLAVTENPVGHVFHRYRVAVAGRYFYRIVTSDDSLEHFFAVTPSAFTTPLPP